MAVLPPWIHSPHKVGWWPCNFFPTQEHIKLGWPFVSSAPPQYEPHKKNKVETLCLLWKTVLRYIRSKIHLWPQPQSQHQRETFPRIMSKFTIFPTSLLLPLALSGSKDSTRHIVNQANVSAILNSFPFLSQTCNLSWNDIHPNPKYTSFMFCVKSWSPYSLHWNSLWSERSLITSYWLQGKTIKLLHCSRPCVSEPFLTSPPLSLATSRCSGHGLSFCFRIFACYFFCLECLFLLYHQTHLHVTHSSFLGLSFGNKPIMKTFLTC